MLSMSILKQANVTREASNFVIISVQFIDKLGLKTGTLASIVNDPLL
jgi:hypothetical protein